MGWLLDRLVLKNTRHALPAGDLSQEWLEVRNRRMDVYRWESAKTESGLAPFHVVKFIGAAGRAETVSIHPFDIWKHRPGTITVANPPGFGRSPGKAKLDDLVELGQATVQRVMLSVAPGPLLLIGSSLGGAVAICTAARAIDEGLRPAGIIVRDAPSLRHVISQRFGWKSGWLPVQLVIRSIPPSLDAVSAARRCDIPAVIVTSLRDRVVPLPAQHAWIDHYAGPSRVIELPDAGHYDPMGGRAAGQYREALTWLESQISQLEQCR